MAISACVFAALVGVAIAFPAMQPLTFNNNNNAAFNNPAFSSMNFNAFNTQQNVQKQGQKQAQAASTGDASADEGQIASNQQSNQFTNENGTKTNAGSQAGCAGGNCALTGAAQLQASDQNQKQKQGTNQNLLGGQSKGANSANSLLSNQNANIQKQSQKQTQIGAAATGTGTAARGNVTSNQNTVGETNDKGGNVLSTNFGAGSGQQINLNGASQAKLQAQGASQLNAQNSDQGINNAALGVNRPGCVTVSNGINNGKNQTLQSQKQNQVQGDAASAGQGTAAEGDVNSAQLSNLASDKHGTLSSSSSAGAAKGKGLHLSGASSSTVQQAAQKQTLKQAAGSHGEQEICS